MAHKKRILSRSQRKQQKAEAKVARAEVRGEKKPSKKRERKVTTLPTIKLKKESKITGTPLEAFGRKGTAKERAAVTFGIVPGGGGVKAPSVIKKVIGFAKGVPKSAAVARSRGLSVVDELAQVGKSGKVEDLTKTFVDVTKIGKTQKLSRNQARALAVEIGKRRVRQVADRATANRFAVNAKTQGLTTSLLVKVGLGFSAAGLFVGAVSSYPFAGFIKEEALQTLGFAFNTAERNKDIEGMELALNDVEDILNKEKQILDLVPYINVLRELGDFFDAARTKLVIDRRRLDSLREEQEEGETAFQEERRVADEQALQRKLDEQGLTSEYFALIRDEKFEEAEELRQTRLKELEGGN